MADTKCIRLQGSGESEQSMYSETINKRKAIESEYGRLRQIWEIEPSVGRVAYGVPNGVDRLKGLGNAVVPQIPELIGKAIMGIEACQ